MACLLSNGIPLGCRDNMGGYKRVLFANRINVDSILPGLNTLPSEATQVSMSGGTKFYEFVPSKMSSNYVENIQSNVQNCTTSYEQVLTLMFAKNEASKRDQVKLLGQADLIAIVEKMDGTYWLLGEENGLDLTGGSSSSGTTLGDFNGWNLTFTANETSPARTVTGSIIAGLL